jgi:hypothetical protein
MEAYGQREYDHQTLLLYRRRGVPAVLAHVTGRASALTRRGPTTYPLRPDVTDECSARGKLVDGPPTCGKPPSALWLRGAFPHCPPTSLTRS